MYFSLLLPSLRPLHIACAIAALWLGGAVSGATSSDGTQVRLEIGAVIDTPSPTLSFTVTNNSNGFLEDRGLCRHNNGIRVLRPDGSATGYQLQVGGFADHTPLIRPGETVTRTMPVATLVSACGMQDDGTYRIYWHYEGFRSTEFQLHRTHAGDKPKPDPSNAHRDQSTPKAALKTLLRALDRGDSAIVRRALESDGRDESQRAIEGAFIQRAFASNMFRTRCETKFGKTDADTLALFAPPDVLKAIDDGVMEIPEYFQEATLNFSGRQYRFVSGWKVAASNFMRDGRPDVEHIWRQTKAINAAAQEIQSGKLKSRVEALQRVNDLLASK